MGNRDILEKFSYQEESTVQNKISLIETAVDAMYSFLYCTCIAGNDSKPRLTQKTVKR